MTRTLVLGANGQDGSYLVEALLRRGHKVVGVGRQPLSRYIADGPDFRYQSLDLTDARALDQLLAELRPDIVFHVAAIHGAAGFSYEPLWESMVAVNVNAVQRVLEHARIHQPGLRLVTASSSKIFGTALPGAVDEATPYRATCCYSIGKIAALELVRHYRKVHGVAAGSLILFNHESPRRPPEFFIPKIARCLAEALAGSTTPRSVKTLDFHADWSAAEELMDIAVDIAETAPEEDFVLASGTTWHARAAVAALFAQNGLDYRDHIIETLPPQEAGSPYRVCLGHLAARIGRRPVRTLFDIVDGMI